jgi:hypothetical protein
MRSNTAGRLTMVVLQLTESEARTLERAVARRVSDMMAELVHTTEHAAHAELRSTYEELERLHRRLSEQGTST